MHYKNILLIFVARQPQNIREIVVKNCEKSKNRRKSVWLCAASELRHCDLHDLCIFV